MFHITARYAAKLNMDERYSPYPPRSPRRSGDEDHGEEDVDVEQCSDVEDEGSSCNDNNLDNIKKEEDVQNHDEKKSPVILWTTLTSYSFAF